MKMKKTAWVILLILLLAAAGGALFSTPPASAQMVPTPDSDRLAPWPTVYPPAQADQGAQVYYQRCMVCHGDRGQGLTVEWRGVFDPEDQNCWQSGCHNQTRLPPDGFVFPKAVPAVAGPGVLTRFGTAQNLFDFLKHSMPYQAPNSLGDEAYWQITAYLLRTNGFYSSNLPLNEETAASVRLIPATPLPVVETDPLQAPWWLIALGGLALLGVGAWILSRSRR